LAIPARANFLGPEEKPSASVVVDLRPGYRLSPDQVQGIVNLVAGSVPKLSSDKVIVIDSSGRPLKEIVAVAPTTEAEKLNVLKLKHEEEMQRRIETMLDPILGPGKVIVRANVQVNLQETLMTKEEFDPDNKVVRSQRLSSDDSGTKGGAPGVQANIPGGDATKAKANANATKGNADSTKASADSDSKRSSESTTYEIGHTTSRIMEPRGNIQKLSVAVLVDGKYEKDKYIARTTAEMDIIKGMVKRAVGFDSDRGDEIEIANVPFKVQPVSPLAPLGAPELKDMLMSPMGIGIGVGALLLIGGVLFFVMRGKKKPAAMEPTTAQTAAQREAAPSVATVREEVAAVAQKIVVSQDPRKEQLSQIARDYHDATVHIVRTWLQEEAAKARTAGGGSPTIN
jgi:flagellar M-ring protein FliF